MRHLIIMIVTVLAASYILAEPLPPKDNIVLKAFYYEHDGRLFISAYLYNNGDKPATFITHQVGAGIWASSKNIMLLDFTLGQSTFDGRSIALAVADLRLVTVLPGEAAQLEDPVEITKDYNVTIPPAFNVRYAITDAAGHRYGTWSGELHARPEPMPKKRSSNQAAN